MEVPPFGCGDGPPGMEWHRGAGSAETSATLAVSFIYFLISMFLPFLKNPFSNKKIAREDFLALLDGNLSRMTGLNKASQYTAMLGALQPHRDAYATFMGDQDVNMGQRLGKTDAVEKQLADFKRFAKEELLVDVEYIFGRQKPNPAALTSFLPKGRKEYSGANFLTLPTLLKRVAELTATYKQELGNDLAARAAHFQQSYLDARQTQGESKGEVQDDSTEERKLRKAAARQLKLNLLDQLTLHIDEPDTVKSLYDPAIFTQPTKVPKSTEA
jgi:hypothetical protein